jgi:hypothetical protein
MYFSSFKRRTETCVDGEGGSGAQMGPVTAMILHCRVSGPPPISGCTYHDSGAPEFGFSKLWLVNTPESGDTTCGFYDPNMLSAWEHVGVMACAVKMLDVGGIGTGNPQLWRLKKP